MEFDVELTNACADTHEEMLEIMGAAVPNAKPSDAANETESNSGVDDDTELSPRLDNPHFLHVRVVPKSGASHTYTPLSTRGIQIPQDRSQRGIPPCTKSGQPSALPSGRKGGCGQGGCGCG